MYPISKLGTKVEQPEDLPLDPHWQIWVRDSYTPVTGWESEGGSGSKTYRWDVYAYLDETEWRSDLLKLNEDAMNPKTPNYSKKVFVAFEAGGRVQARVNISLVGKPPRCKQT